MINVTILKSGMHFLQNVYRVWSIAAHGEPGHQGEMEWEDAVDDPGQRGLCAGLLCRRLDRQRPQPTHSRPEKEMS